MTAGSYYATLAQRYPVLPIDVKTAMDLYERCNYSVPDALNRISHARGEYWASVKLNVLRMPHQWAQAVRMVNLADAA